jgi:hypothetical protein
VRAVYTTPPADGCNTRRTENPPTPPGTPDPAEKARRVEVIRSALAGTATKFDTLAWLGGEATR